MPARARDRPLACRRERGHVRHRASAREGPGLRRKADELGDPADGLILDLRRRGRPDGEVRVEARGEEIAEHADLEARRADEGEVARAGLGDRLVERPPRVVEDLERPCRELGQRRLEQRPEPVVDRRLRQARVVEAAPPCDDDLGGTFERLLARDVEAKAHEGRIGVTSSVATRSITARHQAG